MGLFIGVIAFLFSLIGLCLSFIPALEAQEIAPITRHHTEVEVVEVAPVEPTEETERGLEVPQLSAREHLQLLRKKLQLREALDALVDNHPLSPPGLPLLPGRAAQVADAEAEFHGNPAELVIGRNNRNTKATGALGSTLAEPAAANNARNIFAAGNLRHAEFSSNGGATWTNVSLPGGPSDAPILCCDHEVIIDGARRVTFHSALYLNANATNGVVRIFVRRNPPTANCFYNIRNGSNTLPDYPHLGLTKRFLYLTTNNIAIDGTSFRRIQRFNIDQMVDCVPFSSTIFTQSSNIIGQRVWVPAGGTNNIETMIWGQLDNTTTFRIFRWPEASSSPTSVTRSISASTFTNSDCRGGINNTDWIERETAFSITGFRLRCAAAPGAAGGSGVLACYWNAGPDSAHSQGHIHAAVFSLANLSLLAQPHLFNNNVCFGYPVVTANERGDIGISVALGGRKGGGGGSSTAVQGAVGLDDEFTPGLGVFGTLVVTASGTHNPDDLRFGDYFTIHPHEPCGRWFSATNYTLLNGTDVVNVNSRYIEFGRRQSERCWRAHKDQAPAP